MQLLYVDGLKIHLVNKELLLLYMPKNIVASESGVGRKEGKLGPVVFLTLQDAVNLGYGKMEGIRGVLKKSSSIYNTCRC